MHLAGAEAVCRWAVQVTAMRAAEAGKDFLGELPFSMSWLKSVVLSAAPGKEALGVGLRRFKARVVGADQGGLLSVVLRVELEWSVEVEGLPATVIVKVPSPELLALNPADAADTFRFLIQAPEPPLPSLTCQRGCLRKGSRAA